jgi:hypothetical protein
MVYPAKKLTVYLKDHIWIIMRSCCIPCLLTPAVDPSSVYKHHRSIGGICHVHWQPGVSVLPTDPLPADQWAGPGVNSDRSAKWAAGGPSPSVQMEIYELLEPASIWYYLAY